MPDIKTVMLIYVITNVISAGAVAVIWSQNRGRYAGISFWLVGLALQAAGPVFMVLRGLIPDVISMTGSNTIVLAGIIIILIGLERFIGERGRQIQNYVLLAVFIAVSAYFAVVQPSLMARDIAVTAVITIYTLQCAWLLLRRADPGMRQITYLAGIVFAVYAGFSFVRIILTFLFPEQSNDFFKSGPVNALAMTGYTLLNTCLTISLVLMVNRRLLSDVKAQEEKFTTAFHSSPYAITLIRASDGRIFEVNDGFVDITGYQYAEVIGKTTLDVRLWVREEDRLAVINELAQGREIHGVEYQFHDKAGKVLTGLFSAGLVTINNEKCYLASIGNITERKQAEETLARSEEKYRTILDNMQDSYIEVDLAGNFTFINEATCRNLGYTIEELIGQSFSKIAPGQDEVKAIFEAYNEVYKKGEPHTGFAFKAIRKDGSTGYAETSISLIKNEQGKPIGFRSVGRDVTERKQMEQKLEEMATHDFLTGLPNRVLLTDRFSMAEALARRNKARLAVMSLDLDKFKTINDMLGHEAGDQVLKTVSARLAGIIRSSDTIARVGGDEFILVMMETNHIEDTTVIAQKVLDSFTEPLLINGHQLYLSTSIGIAIYPEDAQNMETLINKSDAAMYYSKGHGRNQFKFFSDGDVRMGGDHKSGPPVRS